METKLKKNGVLVALAITLAVLISSPTESASVAGGFLYTLSNFTGPIPYNSSRVTVDRDRSEIYVLYQNILTVFNESGMEIDHFGEDIDLGRIADVAVDEQGDILLLAYKDSRPGIVRCNYRGEPKSWLELPNLPEEFSDFAPNRMVYQDGNFYLASLTGFKIVIVDREGNFKKGYDVFALLDVEKMERSDGEISGFSVDRDGNMLMTVPVLFRAYVLSPDGNMRYFGKPGGAPGRFNIAAGITRDSKGNYLIVDKLKAAVLVFDKDFNFVTQFGSYGKRPGNFTVPDDIAIDSRDRVYVTQMGRRGVGVYTLGYN
jgi:6-bladed beta-propeller protein